MVTATVRGNDPTETFYNLCIAPFVPIYLVQMILTSKALGKAQGRRLGAHGGLQLQGGLGVRPFECLRSSRLVALKGVDVGAQGFKIGELQGWNVEGCRFCWVWDFHCLGLVGGGSCRFAGSSMEEVPFGLLFDQHITCTTSGTCMKDLLPAAFSRPHCKHSITGNSMELGLSLSGQGLALNL